MKNIAFIYNPTSTGTRHVTPVETHVSFSSPRLFMLEITLEGDAERHEILILR